MSNFGFNSDLLISILLVAGSFLLALILELIGDFVFKAGKIKMQPFYTGLLIT